MAGFRPQSSHEVPPPELHRLSRSDQPLPWHQGVHRRQESLSAGGPLLVLALSLGDKSCFISDFVKRCNKGQLLLRHNLKRLLEYRNSKVRRKPIQERAFACTRGRARYQARHKMPILAARKAGTCHTEALPVWSREHGSSPRWSRPLACPLLHASWSPFRLRLIQPLRY